MILDNQTIQLPLHEVSAHLSHYVQNLLPHQSLIVTRHNIPFAEIRPFNPKPKKKRPIGLAKGDFMISESFFDPLPDDLLDYF